MAQTDGFSTMSLRCRRATGTCPIFFMAVLGVALMGSETLAFSVAPTSLSYTASSGSSRPPTQAVTFSKKSLTSRPWTSSGDVAWITVSPSFGTIVREQDQIAVQVDATGLAIGTYSGNVRISIQGKNGGVQVTMVPVTLAVSGGATTTTPSIFLNPASLSFSGTAGGTVPLARTINLTNPTGGTLTWALTDSASWLGLNIASGTTTTEVDSISANVGTTGLAAGTYNTAITVAASGASNSPQIIPVTLTLSAPTTTGSASLTWDPNADTDLAGYKVYIVSDRKPSNSSLGTEQEVTCRSEDL